MLNCTLGPLSSQAGWVWIRSTRSALADKRCPHAPKYCSRPSGGSRLKNNIVFFPARGLSGSSRSETFTFSAACVAKSLPVLAQQDSHPTETASSRSSAVSRLPDRSRKVLDTSRPWAELSAGQTTHRLAVGDDRDGRRTGPLLTRKRWNSFSWMSCRETCWCPCG